MINENGTKLSRFQQAGGQPTILPFGSGDQKFYRYDPEPASIEHRTFVSRDLLSQVEGKFNERVRSLEKYHNVIKDELKKLTGFFEQLQESHNELKLSVKENQLRLEHVARDSELEKFRGEMEKTRRELESEVSEGLHKAEQLINNNFRERTKTTIAWVTAISGIIAIVVSIIINILP